MKLEINLGESYSKYLLLLSFFTYGVKRLKALYALKYYMAIQFTQGIVDIVIFEVF